MSEQAQRYVIVELDGDPTWEECEEAGKEIIDNLDDARSAQPAYWDGFGHYVVVGNRIERKERKT